MNISAHLSPTKRPRLQSPPPPPSPAQPPCVVDPQPHLPYPPFPHPVEPQNFSLINTHSIEQSPIQSAVNLARSQLSTLPNSHLIHQLPYQTAPNPHGHPPIPNSHHGSLPESAKSTLVNHHPIHQRHSQLPGNSTSSITSTPAKHDPIHQHLSHLPYNPTQSLPSALADPHLIHPQPFQFPANPTQSVTSTLVNPHLIHPQPSQFPANPTQLLPSTLTNPHLIHPQPSQFPANPTQSLPSTLTNPHLIHQKPSQSPASQPHTQTSPIKQKLSRPQGNSESTPPKSRVPKFSGPPPSSRFIADAQNRYRHRCSLIAEAQAQWMKSTNSRRTPLDVPKSKEGLSSEIETLPEAKAECHIPAKEVHAVFKDPDMPPSTTPFCIDNSKQESTPAVHTNPKSDVVTAKAPAVKLDKFQAAAIAAAERGESFFLTGSAGTGKSFVLREIIRRLRRKNRRVAVAASTGCAAVAIGGCTIHSLLSLGLGLEPESLLQEMANSNRRMRARVGPLHVLIIDEISMIDSFLFDKIELVCSYAKLNNPYCSGKSSVKRMFGGLQVIVCGDFFQLPPVAPSCSRLQLTKEKFFAFESHSWQEFITKTFSLRQVHRQSDMCFVGVLDEIRHGFVSKATGEVLRTCTVGSNEERSEITEKGEVVCYTKLYPYRHQVRRENDTHLGPLATQGIRYDALDRVEDKLGKLSEKAVRTMLDNVSGLKEVHLKRGCRVLCTRNLDVDQGIVNGSAGVVIGFLTRGTERVKQLQKMKELTSEILVKRENEMAEDGIMPEEVVHLENEELAKDLKDWPRCAEGFIVMKPKNIRFTPIVKFDNGKQMTIPPFRWEVFGLQGKVVGSRLQIPLVLGWALSIHKSQGMTLNRVETDVGRAFDYGQVYVALSRATNLEGLRLSGFNVNTVMAHGKVLKFYKQLECEENAEEEDESCCNSENDARNGVSDSELLALMEMNNF